MKQCPECKQCYYDETLNYCLDDGTRLVHQSRGEESPTAIFTAAVQPGKEQTAILSSVSGPAAVAGGLSPSTDNAIDLQPPATEGSDKLQVRNRWLVILFLILLIPAAGFFAYRYFTPNKQIESIAVMPFVNQSGNTDMEYLSDGMTETLIGSLSLLPNLNVKARSSVFRYKGKETDAQTIGKELNVQAILTGRVVQRGQDVVLNVELIDVKTENVLWTENYSRQLANLVSLQSEIARDVSNKLRLKLSGADEQKLTKNYTTSSEAYQLYLKGRYHWNKRDDEELKKAVEYFNQAITLDPGFALAYTGLADSYALLPFYSGTESAENFTKAKIAATRALEIDDTLAEAHATLANISMWHRWDWAGAERAFKRAIELNPNYPTAHHWYALCLSFLARHQEALAEIRRAHELDPFSLSINLGVVYLHARQYDEAIKHFRRVNEMNADFLQAHLFLAEAYEVKGMYDEAAKELDKVITLSGGRAGTAASLNAGYKAEGARGYVKEKLKLLMLRWQRSGDGAYQIAEEYASLGEHDQAFGWLDKAFERRDLSLVNLKVTPEFDSMRPNLLFQDLVRRVGFPE